MRQRGTYNTAYMNAQKSDFVKAVEFIWGVGLALNEVCKSANGGACPQSASGGSQYKPPERFSFNEAAGAMMFVQ